MQKFNIAGVTCGACQKLIERRLSKLEGVGLVDVSEKGEVAVHSQRELSRDEVILALKDTEYKLI